MSKYSLKVGRPFPFTDEQVEEILLLWDDGEPAGRIARKYDSWSSTIKSVIERSGRVYESRHARERHYAWRGGRYVDNEGYVQVTPSPEWKFREEMCMGKGERHRRVLEHRKIMADFIDRALLPSETVHHINGNRQDNRLENLQLRQGPHGAGILMICNQCGSHDVSSTEI
jgi:HNH endonuclease